MIDWPTHRQVNYAVKLILDFLCFSSLCWFHWFLTCRNMIFISALHSTLLNCMFQFAGSVYMTSFRMKRAIVVRYATLISAFFRSKSSGSSLFLFGVYGYSEFSIAICVAWGFFKFNTVEIFCSYFLRFIHAYFESMCFLSHIDDISLDVLYNLRWHKTSRPWISFIYLLHYLFREIFS